MALVYETGVATYEATGRRVTYMLLWITLIEVALITLGVGLYFSEFT